MFIARLTEAGGQTVYVNLDRVDYFRDSSDRNRTGTMLRFAGGTIGYVSEPVEQVAGLIPGGVARPVQGD